MKSEEAREVRGRRALRRHLRLETARFSGMSTICRNRSPLTRVPNISCVSSVSARAAGRSSPHVSTSGIL